MNGKGEAEWTPRGALFVATSFSSNSGQLIPASRFLFALACPSQLRSRRLCNVTATRANVDAAAFHSILLARPVFFVELLDRRCVRREQRFWSAEVVHRPGDITAAGCEYRYTELPASRGQLVRHEVALPCPGGRVRPA